MANLSKTVSVNIPFILKTHGALNKNDIRSKYVDLEGCSSEFDFGQNKDGWSKLRSAIHTQCQKLVKQGVLIQPARGQFDVAPLLNHVASEFTPFLNGAPATVQTPTPVAPQPVAPPPVEEVIDVPVEEITEPEVEITEPETEVLDEVSTPIEVNVEPSQEETPVDEPTQEEVIEENITEVSVKNPAVIDSYIDHETEELVENVGGSRDYRTPLDEVDDDYISSPVIETTSTLDLPESTDETSSVVETSSTLDLPEPVETLEIFEDDVPEWDGSDNSVDGVYIEPNQKMKYDVKELIRTGAFDPSILKLGSKKTNQVLEGSYLVYRDLDNRNVIITQEDRDDYLVVPVDVDHSELSDKFSEIASQAVHDFENAKNHKEGTSWFIKALVACTHNCQHTDDFGGFVEYCGDEANCPVKYIWSDLSYHVSP